MLHQRTGVVIGDVSGHGVGPALLMAMTRAYLRLLVTRRESPGEILTLANATLAEDMGSERFLTLCLARLDPETRTLVHANAGHSTAFLLNPAGDLKLRLRRTGLALGWDPKAIYTDSDELKLEPGDVLVLATDGIEEAVNADGGLFGSDRLLDVVRSRRHESASVIVDALYEATRSFSGDEPQEDDITAVVVKVLTASSPDMNERSV